jgi:hypothetical protein
MFTEILRIKPVLDTASATKMEASLGTRFRRIATTFRRGLSLAIKGSVIGLSLALLTRFLNPLEKIEEKIRKLLDDAKGEKDLADEYGTTPGKLRSLQNAAGTIGVTPETLKDLMNKYAKAIEKAREELRDPNSEISDSTRALKNYANDKDLAESFLQFLQNVKSAGQAQKGVGTISTREGVRDRTPQETRESIEKAVFDEILKGQSKRLVDANYAQILNNPAATSTQLDKAYDNLTAREQQDRNNTINQETADLLRSSRQTTPGVIDAIAAKAQRDLDKQNLDYQNFQNLKKAQETVDTISIGIEAMQQLVLKIVTALTTLVEFATGLKQSRIFKGISGSGGVKK